MKAIVETISALLGAIGLIGGLGFALYGITTPSRYNTFSASAIQMSQVWDESHAYILFGIALLLAGILVLQSTKE